MREGMEHGPHTDALVALCPEYSEPKDRLSNGALSLSKGAEFYLRGLSLSASSDFEKAFLFYDQSLYFGNDQAAVNLGYIYAYGRLGVVDQRKAADYFYQGMKMGNPEGAMKYGDFLQSGSLVPRNEELAFKLFDMGYDLAQSVDEDDLIAGLAYRLGCCYEHGWGTDVDHIDALGFFLQAAQRYERSIENGNHHYRKRWEDSCRSAARLQEEGVLLDERPLPAAASFNWDGELLDSFGVPLHPAFYRDMHDVIFIARRKFARERSRVTFRRSVMETPLSFYVSLSGGLESDGSRDFIVDFSHPDSTDSSIDRASIRSWLSVEGDNGFVEQEIEQPRARLLWRKIGDLGIAFWNDEYVSFRPEDTSFEWSICVNGKAGSFTSTGASVGPDNLEKLVALLDECLNPITS